MASGTALSPASQEMPSAESRDEDRTPPRRYRHRAGPRSGSPLAQPLRAASHVTVWAMVLVPALTQLGDGWRAVRDDAEASINAFRTLSVHSPLVGSYTEASLGHHVAFDLGPLPAWSLALPVHIDPAQGALWGAAIVTGLALSVAVEAAWSARGWPGAVAVGLVVADLAWLTQFSVDPVWNPHLGLAALIATAATAWAVGAGRFAWWPVTVLAGSFAAQSHLVYAAPAVALVVVAPLLGISRGRPSGWRWVLVGVTVAAACWIAPLLQEAFGHPGNLSVLLHEGGGGHHEGVAFGLRSLSTATGVDRPIWLTGYPYLLGATPNGFPDYVAAHSLVAGIVSLVALAASAVWARLSRRHVLASAAAVTLLLALGTVASFSSFLTGQSLAAMAYLGPLLWLVGAVVWLTLAWSVVAAGGAALGAVVTRRDGWPSRGGAAAHPGHAGRGSWAGGTLAAVAAGALSIGAGALLVTAAVQGGATTQRAAGDRAAAVAVDLPRDRAVVRWVERHVPRGPVTVEPQPLVFLPPRYPLYAVDQWGISWMLLQAGWEPHPAGAFFGAAIHLPVPPVAPWPTAVVRLNPSTDTVTGRVDPGRRSAGPGTSDQRSGSPGGSIR